MIKIIVYLSALLAALLVGCTSKTTDKNNNASNDSIQKYIALASNDTLDHAEKVKILDKELILKKTEKILKDQPNSKENRLFLNKLAEQSYRIGSSKIMFSTTKLLLNRATIVNDSSNIAAGFNLLGKYYLDFSKNDSSFIYFVKAEKIYIKQRNNNKLGDINLNKAFIYLYENDYPNCEISASKALLNIVFNGENQRKKYDAYNLIGISSNELKKYDKAIEYHLKALKVANNSLYQTSPILITTTQNNLGVVYQNINDNKKAINYFQQALAKKGLENTSPDLYAMLLDNLAYSKFKIGDNSELPNLFYTSLKIREKKHLNSGVVVNKIHLSEYFSALNDTVNSKKFAFEALVLAKSINIRGDILASLNQLSLVDKVKSSIYSKEYIEISDSLQLEERNSKDKFARIQFETDEISQEKETAIKQKWIITGIALAVLVILFLVFIIFLQRSRQKELQFLRSQEKANEEIYQLMLTQKSKEEAAKQAEKKRISLELHDGIMNKLASTRLNLAVLSHNREDATITKCLTHITDIYQIEQEIRTIAHDLNKEVFQKSDSYSELLQDFVSDQNKNATTHYELEVEEAIDWTAISGEIKMNLYRIIQEACHNINKHAAAKKAIISIILDKPNICLSICDEGIGFDTSKKAEGIGIQNIQQRVKLLNGKFSMYSNPHAATSLNVAIPI